KIRHMPPHPEFIGADILVADDQLLLDVDMDDRRQLLHFEPLRIRAADADLIDEYPRGVDGTGIDQSHRRDARISFLVAFAATMDEVGRSGWCVALYRA